MRKVLTSRGEVLVDASDWKRVIEHSWCGAGDGYHKTCLGGTFVYMHRFILSASTGQVVDHINGNKSDNRRANLRICSTTQNNWNTRSKGKTSKFRGVSRYRNKWQSKIRIGGGKRIYLGIFNTELEAAAAYRIASIKYHGEFTYNEELRSK